MSAEMRWLSVDPAKVSGVAYWRGGHLSFVGSLRPMTKTEVKQFNKVGKGKTYTSDSYVADILFVDCTQREKTAFVSMNDAYKWVAATGAMVVSEHPMGHHAKSVDQIAWRRGYLAGLVEANNAKYQEVNFSEWRRVTAETFNISWPRDSALGKQLAIKLVKENFPELLGDIQGDEAEAILVGVWALRTRTVDAPHSL